MKIKGIPNTASNTTIARILAIASISAFALLVGCESTSSTTGNSGSMAEKSASSKGGVVLKKGMTKLEVISMLGDPNEIEIVNQDEAQAEIWIYRRERVESSTIEYNGEQERVYADPDTGAFVTVREPIYRNEQVMATVTTQLLFNGDELVAFKEQVVDGIINVGDRRS